MQYSFNLNKVKTMIQFKVYNFLMKEFLKKNSCMARMTDQEDYIDPSSWAIEKFLNMKINKQKKKKKTSENIFYPYPYRSSSIIIRFIVFLQNDHR